MEPRIQYAKTKDGVSIAFSTVGEGMPVVQLPGQFSHIQMEWQEPNSRRWLEGLAEKRMLVRYDRRGSGLSERDVTDYSLDAHLLDLEAVVDRLGLESFALFAPGLAGPVAITYATRHPEHLSHLMLWCSFPRGSDIWRSSRAQAFRAIRVTNWELYTEALVEFDIGLRLDEDMRRAGVTLIREAVTPDSYQAFMEAVEGFDATDLLPQVKSPTLVLHRREVVPFEIGLARELASRIPDARLVLLEGTSVLPMAGDMESVLSAIDEFLGESEEDAAEAEAPPPTTFRTILFTDMEGSTTLTQRLGDAAAQDVLRTHNAIIRDALNAHNGSETKHTGDGIMASFSSASRALECSIAIQRAFAAHNAAAAAHPEPVEGRAEPIRVRIGLNAGEPVAEDDPAGRRDLFGTAVQLAARICAHAQPEQILAPIVVRELAAGKRFLFSDLGDVALRGFDDPVRLFEVRWREEAR
jgi:class 3 adenylate cyclase